MATTADYTQSILLGLSKIEKRWAALTPERRDMVHDAVKEADDLITGVLDALDELDEQS